MAEQDTIGIEVEIDGAEVRALWCVIEEALSELPCVRLEVSLPEGGAPEPTAIVGKKLALRLRRIGDDASPVRCFGAVVVEATRSADKDGRPTTAVVAAPRLWRLGKRADCRVFRDSTVPDILQSVLQGAGASDVETRLGESYPARPYTVQYRETDLCFVLRLCAEEGIWLLVRHDEDGRDTVVLGDDPAGLGPLAGQSTLPYAETYGFAGPTQRVMWVAEQHEVRTDKVMLRDYDLLQPKVPVDGRAVGKDEGPKALELYDYPARSFAAPTAQRYAQVLLDGLQCERDVVSGETTALTLAPGLRFAIEGHPYAVLDQEYLAVRVRTEARARRSFHHDQGRTTTGEGGEGRDFVCRFEAIPTARSAFRPPRRERASTVAGAQTAMTAGPGEIHVDEHGRVKVKFHWDRVSPDDGSSSDWARTSQVPLGGSMLLPRVGWEVSVRHLEGDADRPVVFARMYNALAMPPYGLPGGAARSAVQTATTPGGGTSNEVRFDDSKGGEQMFFNASKDATIAVENNTTESIGNDQTRSVGSNRTVEITNSLTSTVGASQASTVGANQTVSVETFMVESVAADHSLDIGGNRTMMVGGDHRHNVTGASSLEVGNVSADVVIGAVGESVLGNMTHQVGTALAELTASDRSIVVGGVRNETTGAVKAVIAFGGRGVEVGGAFTQQVAGAILNKIDADRAEKAGALFTEVAAGAQIVKADKVVFEADGLLAVVMGASTLTLLPALIAVAGTSIKLDGDAAESAALVIDN
ncbi:MAG: type VI secretion system tip protein VgrG [Deltaproteobacteria bacterium]|nr:type VI secretion system tip protein VgrG [Deltaproteobacteria bacterium]